MGPGVLGFFDRRMRPCRAACGRVVKMVFNGQMNSFMYEGSTGLGMFLNEIMRLHI